MSSPTLPAPVAPRLRRPSWRDPRLVVGIVLVALSVALGSWAVSSASRTVPVWAAAGALTPGERLTPGALRVVDVRLGDRADRYLPADRPLPDGLVVTRAVGDGELVARSALGEAAGLDLRSVAVPVDGALSARVRKGSVVDVWFVPDAAPGSDAPAPDPRAVVEGVLVEQVDDAGTQLVVGSSTTLHVLVPTADLPGLLAALGADGSVDVVPVAGADA
ncbi:hypothetical protein ET495_08770 [Xylanimonas allomyrinae]|uniref:SAF domain-containing protein n=1 Tax=Xylanimonas allomyrinae TaxID=2509459 RepID=A0A4P6EM18_9MICO|nr:hypothetical protein [Xylanimonas allomyrinae]QAY63326.1 hypothetical protein ET495_08770 [Xylanimonas allomyrinae]